MVGGFYSSKARLSLGELANLPSSNLVATTMKIILMLSVAGSLAVAVPALADNSTVATIPSAQHQCRTEQNQMGQTAFKALYATNANKSNAFGKCVSKRAAATKQAATVAKSNASKQCTAEEQADSAAFAEKYGTGKNGANAHGKCVSGKAKALTAATVAKQVKSDAKAAKACRTEQKADPSAFATKYATSQNKHNAFGKCVSTKVRAQQS